MLTVDRVDLGAGTLVFESLKQRRDSIYRTVPVPLPCSKRSSWCTPPVSCRPVAARAAVSGCGPWLRMAGWRAARGVMAAAGLDEPQALPKGPRHGFGVAAVTAGISLNLVTAAYNLARV